MRSTSEVVVEAIVGQDGGSDGLTCSHQTSSIAGTEEGVQTVPDGLQQKKEAGTIVVMSGQ